MTIDDRKAGHVSVRRDSTGRHARPRPEAVEEATLLEAVEARTLASLPQAELVRRLSLVAVASGALLVLVGGVAMLGWIVDAPSLYRVSAETASMKFSTALGLTTIGVAILLSRRGDRVARTAATVLTTGVALLSGLTISEYVLDVTYPGDNLFGLDAGDLGGDPAGRMSLATAIGILLVAVALLLIDRGQVMAGQLVASVSLIIGITTLVGYAYGVESLYTIGAFKSIALRTAVGLVLGSLGVLLQRGDAGYMSLISGNTAGGIIVRQFLPVATLVPVLGGLLVVHAADTGETDKTAGLIAIAATLVGVVGFTLVWLQSSRLRQVDLRRAGAENAFALAREAIEARDAIAEELELSERRANAIIAGSCAAYVTFGLAGTIEGWNDAALTLFGLSPEEMRGKQARELVQRSKVNDGRSEMMAYLAGEGPPPADQQYEADMIARDGRRLRVDISLWTVTDEAGLTFHAFINDVTGRRQAELELRRANDDLADFSAAMAHDLRTPLTVVKGFSGMLATKLAGTPESDLAERIDRAADRGARLIDDILSFAQIGRTALERHRVDVDTLARRVAAEQLSASGRDADVRVRPLPEIGGDHNLLETLLSNLIGNSLKYVPDDRYPVVVVDAITDPDTAWPVLRVADNGAPITDGERIFDMFERGAADDRTVGSGVGLAVCRRIAELHGGRIWLEVSEDGGPRFCVLLSNAPTLPTDATEPVS
ncbi:sensor histidine kinase [Nocardioides sp.]|uniref:sensor histidine kinase n=1 Tax=Nocardioides sp. TaxID=35761 RepID=UPI002B271CB0|nr:ATP-binding protein [Nocardioides sp.]